MARTNESAVQRLQVGLVGLLVVLICVSIASMILSRADDNQAPATALEGGQSPDGKAKDTAVTPGVPEQPAKQQPQTPPQN